MKHPWFGAKTFGIGIAPKGWRGWLAMGVFIAIFVSVLVIMPRLLADIGLPTAWTALGALALVAAFLVVVVLTSDHKPLRWRWGRD